MKQELSIWYPDAKKHKNFPRHILFIEAILGHLEQHALGQGLGRTFNWAIFTCGPGHLSSAQCSGSIKPKYQSLTEALDGN